MAIQKKHGKGRLDKYYYLAKEKGYRARAAFKLIQLNKKYSFLQKSRCLIDLCAAPGSWLQVAAETMPVNSLIVGVDLAPIKPIPRAITFQGDITTDKCRATIRGHLKTFKADAVIHDGAPNVGTAWVQDAFSQNELVLSSLRLAADFLAPGGVFVTKVFRSKDSAKLEWIFKQLFNKVEQTKPPSSRNVSAETFYVCLGYKAPKQLDHRFLDPKYAFAEVEDAAPNNEAKVFNPEKKKRKRDGYEENDWTQFHEVPASDFIQTTDPIKMLGEMNRLSLDQKANGDIALAALDKLPETTQEIRDCCNDLKVLGRKEFKLLLRWRLKVREKFGFSAKAKKAALEAAAAEEAKENDEVAAVESMDEELALQEDLQRMKDMSNKVKRKERRKENEKKQKEVVRMQMNMTTPMELGLEQVGPNGEDAMFQLKAVDRAGLTGKLARGRMHSAAIEQSDQPDAVEDESSDEDGDDLERELDSMYEDYQTRRENRDAKARAKRARKEFKDHDDTEFTGFSDQEDVDDDKDELVQDDDSDVSSNEEEDGTLVKDLDTSAAPANGLTKRAAMFFNQDLFKDIDGLDELPEEPNLDSGIDMADSSDSSSTEKTKAQEPAENSAAVVGDNDVAEESDVESGGEEATDEDDADEADEIEVIKSKDDPSTWTDEEDDEPAEKGRPNIDIITAEAMTLAHQLATGKITKSTLEDDGFNKYTLRDTDGLPDWFLDDEGQHSRPQRPITKEAADAIKEKMRALNARPIKKVREAKARKAMRAATRLEKLKRKSALLADSEDVSEKDKASQISKLMAKAKRQSGKKKQPVKVVVARGGNRGNKGRPGGVKGKYKMVDARLKKDVRAEKRLKKARGR
ncbi:AdoMet-dependent rRNA methyltransferase spb1 [Sphaceloma murrayae]|uniref:AdoMet-dependent rRNA methyltransferase spb1 n=1 Tax=Sphaceloma murrayae TaxID=2082308 RepID=A0A2K1QRB0_9PEZI|nr:AdoMet-dependent rRNA methyltransferase spb1 [Sphaceloma murrayae]